MSGPDLESWAGSQTRTHGRTCKTCRHEQATKRLDEIMAAVESVYDRNGSHSVSLDAVYDKLLEDVPSYALRPGGMKGHLRRCRSGLYRKLFRVA